jgi:N-carbamoyl-L-amino-acid hydrolase
VLDDAKTPIGIVEGIVGITWINVRITGQADHAGPSPMALRHDALAAAADIILLVERLASNSGPPVVGTVGRLDLEPNIINTIPGKVEMSVDFRHPDADGLERLVDQLTESADEIARRRGVDIDLERFWTSPPTAFDERIVEAVTQAADAVGTQSRRLWSGAGHDAKYAAELTPTGMIFVRSRGGLSHCEQEFSDPDDIVAGVATLLRTVVALDASLDPNIT